jgi:hypothetical protein
MWTQIRVGRPEALGGDRVVEVTRGGRVDREGGKVPEVAPRHVVRERGRLRGITRRPSTAGSKRRRMPRSSMRLR